MMARYLSSPNRSTRSGIAQYFNETSSKLLTTKHHALATEFSTFVDKPQPEKIQQLHHVDAVFDLTELDKGYCPQTSLCGPDSRPHHSGGLKSEDTVTSTGTRFLAVGGQTQIQTEAFRRPNARAVEILRRFYGQPARAVHHEPNKTSHKNPKCRNPKAFSLHQQQQTSSTMTSSARYTLHAGSSRHLSSTPEETTASLPFRPRRSQAIAIKRTEEKVDEIRESSTAEYDWATWRMYNRIIDHRQKHPTTYTVDESEGTSGTKAEHEANAPLASPNSNLLGNGAMTSSSPHATDYSQYGEVFELDM